MKKLEIKNEIVSLFNSIDSTTLNPIQMSWYEWLYRSVKVIEDDKNYKKISKEDLFGCFNLTKVVINDIENFNK
jgi:hypothetical protein